MLNYLNASKLEEYIYSTNLELSIQEKSTSVCTRDYPFVMGQMCLHLEDDQIIRDMAAIALFDAARHFCYSTKLSSC